MHERKQFIDACIAREANAAARQIHGAPHATDLETSTSRASTRGWGGRRLGVSFRSGVSKRHGSRTSPADHFLVFPGAARHMLPQIAMFNFLSVMTGLLAVLIVFLEVRLVLRRRRIERTWREEQRRERDDGRR